MKLRKVEDRKKELFATILVACIIIFVSVYVVYLVNHLTTRVYKVFGRATDTGNTFTHFNFGEFEQLNLRPKKAPVTPAPSSTAPSSTAPVIQPASGTASSS